MLPKQCLKNYTHFHSSKRDETLQRNFGSDNSQERKQCGDEMVVVYRAHIDNDLKNGVQDDVQDDLKSNLQGDIQDDFQDDVYDELQDDVLENDVKDGVQDELSNDVEDHVEDDVKEDTYDDLQDCVRHVGSRQLTRPALAQTELVQPALM